VARFGWSGELGFQLLLPRASEPAVASALLEAGAESGLVEADAEALEILRIEAGMPRLGHELSEDVLPDEARLSRAISYTKGCYTGQEIVARLHSRGQVNHLLVGIEFSQGEAPAEGAEIWPCASGAAGTDAKPGGDRAIGELTSIAHSPEAGWIALGFVRRAHAEPGTHVRIGDHTVRVSQLPFERAGVSGAGLTAEPDASQTSS